MATIDNERHLRYLLLLVEGGALILKALLGREINKSGKTLDEILQANKGHFKKDKKYEQLFPPNGIVDKNTWDISLLCTVILHLFSQSLTSDERHDVKELQLLRNDLAHSASLSKDEQEYNDQRRYVASTLIKLSNGLARPVHDKCQNLIKEFASGPIDIQAATERVRELCRYDEKVSEQFRILTEKVGKVEDASGRLEGKVDIVTRHLEDIILLLRNNEHAGNDSLDADQELRTRMTLRGPDTGLTNAAEQAIVQDFRTALIRDRREVNISQVKHAVMNIFDEIESCDGVKVSGIEQQCVKMSMQYRNSSGLLELLVYFQGDAFKERLLDLVLAVEDMFSCVFHITFEIEGDSLDGIRNSLDIDLIPKEREEPDVEKENIRRENVELLIDIAHLCRRKDRSRVENIFLLGKSGAGKSALVNTVIKVISGQYIPKAKVGAGITQSKTLTLERYKSCGVTREDFADGTQRDLVQGMLSRLPTILDAAGKGDINTESLREILELLIGGYIPPGTSIEALEDLQKQYSVGALKDTVFTESKEDWKVTKVVFVQSCRDTVPQNLVECLHTVLKTIDPTTAQPLYTGDVYVVITKYDLVKDQSRYDSPSGERTVTMEEFDSVEEKVAEVFNIRGALKDNRIRWVSYTDMVDSDNPYIDNIALKFIKRMVMPGNKKEEVVTPAITPAIKLKLEARKWWKAQNFSVSQVLLIIFCIFVGLLLYKLFTAPLK